MKKIILILIAAALIFSSVLVLSSCSSVSERDFEKAPAQTISESVERTFSDFFGKEVGLFNVINGIEDKASLEIYFEDNGEDMALTEAGATLYADMKNNIYSLDASATYESKELSASVYADKSGIFAISEAVFGDSGAYGFNYDTLISELDGSGLANYIELDDDAIDIIAEAVTAFKAELEKSSVSRLKEIRELADDIAKLFKQSTKSATLKIDGKEVDCVAVTYKLDEGALADALTMIYERLLADYEIEGLEDTIDELCDSIEDEDLYITATAHFVKSEGTLAKLEVNTDRDGEAVDFIVNVTKSKMSFIVKYDNEYSKDLTIKKSTYSASTEYEIILGQKWYGEYSTILDGTVTFSEDGALKIEFEHSYTMLGLYKYKNKYKIAGTYEISKNTAKLEITSCEYKKEQEYDGEESTYEGEYEIKVGIIINNSPKAPTAPKDKVDLIEYTKRDWEKLVEAFCKSELGEVFGFGE